MARDVAERRRRAWVARPAGPIWYWPVARLADWWAAGVSLDTGRDARAGLPAVGSHDKVGTPRCEYLGRTARDRAEREWLHYQADCADLPIRLGGVAGRLRVARDQVRTTTEQLATVTTAAAGAPAGGGPEVGTDIRVVRARRAGEHARQQLAAVEAELADLETRVQVRFQVAQTRARRVVEHVRRRGASYLQRLARRHPRGSALIAAWDPDWPELPDWVYGDRSPHLSIDPGGEHVDLDEVA